MPEINLPTYEQVEEVKSIVVDLPSKVVQKAGHAIFTEAGVHTFKVPQGVTKFFITGFGAGGGGAGGGGGGAGGGSQSNQFGGSGGGGAAGGNGGHGFFGFKIPVSVPSNVTEINVTIGEGGTGSVGGNGGVGVAGSTGNSGQLPQKGSNGELTSFGTYLTFLGGVGGNIPTTEAKGGTNSTYTGTGNVPGNGGMGGQGGLDSGNTVMTINGLSYEKTIDLLPNMYACNLTSNSGGNAGNNGANAGGNPGVGGSAKAAKNHTSAERILINNYIRLFHSLPNDFSGLGGAGGSGGKGGIGTNVQGIPAASGEKGKDGTAGKTGLLLIEWG